MVIIVFVSNIIVMVLIIVKVTFQIHRCCIKIIYGHVDFYNRTEFIKKYSGEAQLLQ